MIHLQDTRSIKMLVDQKTGKNKRFVFISAPVHVYIELIKLNGIEFKRKEITIQDATSARPQTNVPFKNSKRPQVVVSQYPENQDKFGRRNSVLGQKYTLMSQEYHKKHHQQKQQIIVKSTITNTRFHLVIKEIKSLSLATPILVELVKKDLRRMLMVQMYFLNASVEQTLNN